MKVIVHGVTGKMGQVVANLTKNGYAGSEYVAGISPDVVTEMPGLYKTPEKCTEQADVLIDFSFHGATKALLDYCVSRNLAAVIATTGHTEEEEAYIKKASEKIAVFHSANMSVGVAVTADLVKRATKAFPGANIEIIETHHNQKLDAPSGTALIMANAVQEVRPECTINSGRTGHGKRTENEIGIHSLRIGNVVGLHEILISTGNETITIKHQANSRDLFGEGAVRAAQFICNKKPGLYNMTDLVGE